jgi:nucleotide-binding universal stress UspA family protein
MAGNFVCKMRQCALESAKIIVSRGNTLGGTMRILLAMEDSKFSEAALQALLGQFRPEDVEVLVLSVVAPPTLSAPPQMEAEYVPEMDDEVSHTQELVEAAAKRLRAAGFETVASARVGEAREIILESAEEYHADLILLGSHGRKGLGRFLLGSVAESVARHAHCSVQIVRIPAAH